MGQQLALWSEHLASQQDPARPTGDACFSSSRPFGELCCGKRLSFLSPPRHGTNSQFLLQVGSAAAGQCSSCCTWGGTTSAPSTGDVGVQVQRHVLVLGITPWEGQGQGQAPWGRQRDGPSKKAVESPRGACTLITPPHCLFISLPKTSIVLEEENFRKK